MGCSSSSAAGASGAKPTKAGGKPTFGYWSTRGGTRGNGTRYLLAYAKVDYDYVQYDIMAMEGW